MTTQALPGHPSAFAEGGPGGALSGLLDPITGSQWWADAQRLADGHPKVAAAVAVAFAAVPIKAVATRIVRRAQRAAKRKAKQAARRAAAGAVKTAVRTHAGQPPSIDDWR